MSSKSTRWAWDQIKCSCSIELNRIPLCLSIGSPLGRVFHLVSDSFLFSMVLGHAWSCEHNQNSKLIPSALASPGGQSVSRLKLSFGFDDRTCSLTWHTPAGTKLRLMGCEQLLAENLSCSLRLWIFCFRHANTTKLYIYILYIYIY